MEMKGENHGAQITVADSKAMRALERVGGEVIALQEKVNQQQDQKITQLEGQTAELNKWKEEVTLKMEEIKKWQNETLQKLE